jgi:hypothetical protein
VIMLFFAVLCQIQPLLYLPHATLHRDNKNPTIYC